ncbi:MAG: hypothetical protein CMI09_15265 [Oceanospirillaceae bacterium]|nr:hypothetical protein [Oceanospirillaceae bacterium]
MLPSGVGLNDLPQVLVPLLEKGVKEKIYSFSEEIKEHQIKGHPGFIWLGKDKEALLDINSGLIWSSKKTQDQYSLKNYSDSLKNLDANNIFHWQLPEYNEFWPSARNKKNPLSFGQEYFINGTNAYLVKEGYIVTNHYEKNYKPSNSTGYILGVCRQYASGIEHLIIDFLKKNQPLIIPDISAEDQLAGLYKLPDITVLLSDLDNFSSPAPELDQRQISDIACGLWEFWHNPETEAGQKANRACEAIGIRPRNPVQDIQHAPVAIDFGTSSTVVAFQDGGRKKLLRVGLSVDDFHADSQPEHYENPTILEFVDLNELQAPWGEQAYRPRVSWDDVHCSHEALSRQRDNEGDPKITASILPKIKQWALRMEADHRVRIQDQEHQQELELPPLTKRNPVKGEPMTVSPDDPFDPIELYAWFLGLAINHRKRGLFLNYYMTFPVAYPKEVKDKILASFRRGLQRSLPESLVRQPQFDSFKVEERASEPAAFAVAALEHFELEPTEAGVAYAVFDFGGGTTDFDFGLYRDPTDAEEDEGFEQVLEHFGSAGDKFLGGENLLENLAYRVFQDNAQKCRENRVTFTKPLDAEDFPASETLIDNSQAAITNTQMLMAQLRPFWEKGKRQPNGTMKLQLLGNQPTTTTIDLKIPYDALADYLDQRLQEGVKKFLHAMAEAFDQAGHDPELIHIFLAGNASRSERLQTLFGIQSNSDKPEQSKNAQDSEHVDAIRSDGFECDESHQLNDAQNNDSESDSQPQSIWVELSDKLKVYPPILHSQASPYSPNTKTGVALGLLDLCPGSATAVVNHADQNQSGEAPFNFHVGVIRRKSFKLGLKRHTPYGNWHELGPIRENILTLVYTQSPDALTDHMSESSSELKYERLPMMAPKGHKAYARATGPNRIELRSAASQEALESGNDDNPMTINLS